MRGLDAATIAAVALDVTKPVYLVLLGFNIPAAFSSGELITTPSTTFLPASMKVTGEPPTLSIFNEGLGLGAAILNQGTAGRSVSVWEVYATSTLTVGAPTGYTALYEIFSGEMSEAVVGETIEIQCKNGQPLKSPRKIIAPPVCNHLPAAGTRIEMPAGVYILK